MSVLPLEDGSPRGVIASPATALFLARSIVQRAPSLLGTDRVTVEQDALRHSARWYVQIRWLAVAAALACVALAVPILGLLPGRLLVPLLAGVAALAVSNVMYKVWLDRARSLRRVLLGQILSDLAIFSVLLHLSGGLDNPIFVLPLLHVALAAIMLRPRDCCLVAGTTVTLVAGVGLSEWSGVLTHYTPLLLSGSSAPELGAVAARLAILTALAFVVAYLATKLADRSRESERRFVAMADRALGERQLLVRALEMTETGLRVVDAACNQQWSNRRWDEWFPRECANSRAAAVLHTVTDGKMRVSELCLGGDGDVVGLHSNNRTLQLTTAPITDARGQVVHVVELVREITQQKHAQAEMARAGRIAAVGELAGRVAHEVNNPIAIISAKARLMLSGHREEMSEKIERELGKIIALADRVALIAQGLLSYREERGFEPMRVLKPWPYLADRASKTDSSR